MDIGEVAQVELDAEDVDALGDGSGIVAGTAGAGAEDVGGGCEFAGMLAESMDGLLRLLDAAGGGDDDEVGGQGARREVFID